MRRARRCSGRDAAYTPLEIPAFGAQLKERSLPEGMVAGITGSLTDISNGQEGEMNPDLERLLGRRLATLEEGLKPFYNR